MFWNVIADYGSAMKYVRNVVALGCALEIVFLVMVHASGTASLVNFGPGLLVPAALVLGFALALTCLFAGVVLLFRRRWRAAACYLLTCTILSLVVLRIL
jgi:hypothetical protein